MRRLLLLSGAALLTVVSASAPASAASESPSSAISCTGTIKETYSPGLTVEQRPTRVDAHSTLSCSGGGVREVSFSSSYTVDASCLVNQIITVGSTEFHWDKGPKSTATFTYAVGRPAGQTVAAGVGSVTGGQFNGYAATRFLASPTADAGKCLGEGITSASGVDQITLVAQR